MAHTLTNLVQRAAHAEQPQGLSLTGTPIRQWYHSSPCRPTVIYLPVDGAMLFYPLENYCTCRIMALVMAPTLRIRLLGEFNLTWHTSETEAPVATLNTPRLQSLLAYLVLHRDAPQSRRHLAFCLWPDLREERARANLRKLFYQLQQALPERARQHELFDALQAARQEEALRQADVERLSAEFQARGWVERPHSQLGRLASEW